ncbi:MAG TPA: DUF1549 and DUF1553 domain-containing protein [Isosphaeraceae bacterium]|jgi:hypothetical protein|nr:DUF1549 and DUF1553 domain-containing protein [Isosphaeraceae bacterium]
MRESRGRRWARRLVAIATALGMVLIATARVRAQEPSWSAEQRSHWSFRVPKRPALPAVKGSGWVRNPIDAFVLAGIDEVHLAPAPEADRRTLIRRLSFDLTGLPPSPEEVEAFVDDRAPDAYERLVDRLLESPHYGERWARPWLDLARFAESDGFKSDKTRPDAWRYRDWVIRALNDDMPYDRFVRLQLAGDEVASGDAEAFIATGFNRQWPFEDNNKVPGLNRQLMLEDMTDTTAAVFLGLTVACARCHDHKYDPISQKDYYRFQALFAASTPRDDYPMAGPFAVAMHAAVAAEHQARLDAARRALATIEQPYLPRLLEEKLAKLPADVRKALETSPEERSAFQEDLLRKNAALMAVEPKRMRSAMTPDDLRRWEAERQTMAGLTKQAPAPLPTATGMADAGPTAPPVRLLRKGNYTSPGEAVAPGFLSVLEPDPTAFRAVPSATSTGRRTALADWLTRPDHPLTSRVLVNRLWQHHFGRAIVSTPSDFGAMGAEPSHPELLDWLATELIARGWSLKAMHRLMVTSATYRQSSIPSAEASAKDPDNTFLARMGRHRLEAEAVRDAMLAVAGRLDLRLGGPSVFPDLPPGVQTRGGWETSKSRADRDRRSIYVFARRNLKYPLFDAFDAPDTNLTCPERNVSVNAPQALMLLNSDLILELARSFAGRVLTDVAARDDPSAFIRRSYLLAFGREPTSAELRRGLAFLDAAADLGDSKALPAPMPRGLDRARAAAMVDYAHALLNLNEFVFVD